MKNKLLFSVMLLIFTLFAGCASTSITSFVDPDYRVTQFKSIVVVANTNKLSDRLALENRLVEVFSTNGIRSIPSYSILPPTRQFSDSSKVEIMLQNKIDCCLMIYFGERGIERVQIPVIGSSTSGSITTNMNKASFNSQTTYIGGEVVDKPYAEFEMKLFDIFNGKMAWIANSFTGGSAYSNFSTVYWSFCNKIIERLSLDNLIITSEGLVKIIRKEIDRIIKLREDNPVLNKVDVIVLNNGEIASGIILERYAQNNNHEEFVEIRINKLDNKKDIQKIFLTDIREINQK